MCRVDASELMPIQLMWVDGPAADPDTVFIIFGEGKWPQLGEGMGYAIKGFKKTMHEAKDEAMQQKFESSITAEKIAPNMSISSKY
jgi:TatA/E family protein of Tat protein translocase